MKNSYRDIIDIFSKDFPELVLEKRTVELEKGKAHCIFLKVPSQQYLLDNWKRVTNSLALNYQKHLETSFEKWNIYLFFLMSESFKDMNLKYTIENNTFSSRKIVEDTSLSLEALVKKHVNNELTLEANRNTTKSVEFVYDPSIYSVLKDKKLKNKKILQKALEKAYNELIKKITEEEK